MRGYQNWRYGEDGQDVLEQGIAPSPWAAAKKLPDPLIALKRTGQISESQYAAAEVIRAIHDGLQSDARAYWAPSSDRVDISLVPELQHLIQTRKAMAGDVVKHYAPWKRHEQYIKVGRSKTIRWKIISEILFDDRSIRYCAAIYKTAPAMIRWHLGKSLTGFADRVARST